MHNTKKTVIFAPSVKKSYSDEELKALKLRNQVRAAVYRIKRAETLAFIHSVLEREEPEALKPA